MDFRSDSEATSADSVATQAASNCSDKANREGATPVTAGGLEQSSHPASGNRLPVSLKRYVGGQLKSPPEQLHSPIAVAGRQRKRQRVNGDSATLASRRKSEMSKLNDDHRIAARAEQAVSPLTSTFEESYFNKDAATRDTTDPGDADQARINDSCTGGGSDATNGTNGGMRRMKMVQAKTDSGGTKSVPLYPAGSRVLYRNSSASESSPQPARVLRAHYYDMMEPYYDIRLERDGREKQTDDAHIAGELSAVECGARGDGKLGGRRLDNEVDAFSRSNGDDGIRVRGEPIESSKSREWSESGGIRVRGELMESSEPRMHSESDGIRVRGSNNSREESQPDGIRVRGSNEPQEGMRDTMQIWRERWPSP